MRPLAVFLQRGLVPVGAELAAAPDIGEHERPAALGEAGKIVYAISDKRMGSDKQATFDLQPTGKDNRNVKITQSYQVTYGFNLLGRYAGMYVSRHVGDAVKAGLSKLTNMLATVPNFDYRTEGSPLTDLKLVELPAEDLLVVNAGNIDRTNDAIKASIKQNQEWIKRVMEANGLEAAGPFRIITTDFGAEKYAFDVAQPVKKKGTEGVPAEELAVKIDGGAAAAPGAARSRVPACGGGCPRWPAAAVTTR
mgnify:CR=1 FL=1